MKQQKLWQRATTLAGFAFIALGVYNSVVINADDFMESDNIRFVKRLDELNGLTHEGRRLAHAETWVKLETPKVPAKSEVIGNPALDQVSVAEAAPAQVAESRPEPTAEAAIKEDLELELVEVFNAKKFPNGTKPAEISGSMRTTDGVIETLSVNLPNSETISIALSEMTGNVFEYELDGQLMSGMMYQMDKTSYMVTLTNGPFEGTRLKFGSKTAAEEDYGNNSEMVAENNAPEQPETEFAPVVTDNGEQIPVGSFGQEQEQQPQVLAENQQLDGLEVGYAPAMEAQQMDVAQNEAQQNQQGGDYGFNFDGQQPQQEIQQGETATF